MLSHERISVFHRDYFSHRIIYTTNFLWLKRKCQRFNAVFILKLWLVLYFHFACLKLRCIICRLLWERRRIFKKIKFRTASYILTYVCLFRIMTIYKLNTNPLRCYRLIQVYICLFFILKLAFLNQLCLVVILQVLKAVGCIDFIILYMSADCRLALSVYSLLITKRLKRLFLIKTYINIMRIFFYCFVITIIFRMIICIIISVEHQVCSTVLTFVCRNTVAFRLPTRCIQFLFRRLELSCFSRISIIQRIDNKLFAACGGENCRFITCTCAIVCNLFCRQYFFCRYAESSFQIFVTEYVRAVFFLKRYNPVLFLRRLSLLCRRIFGMNRLSHKR